MGYLHIDNLYKDQSIFIFKECYALEKIHGTSAHISWNAGRQQTKLFSGGEKYERFAELFDIVALTNMFLKTFPTKDVTLYGEAYGGRQQGMGATYGDVLKFVVFDVAVNGLWLDVPVAYTISSDFGCEFVHYTKVETKLELLEAERDKPSVQAERNGITTEPKSEGVVLRPVVEVRMNNGDRIISKFKRDDFRETRTPRKVDKEKLKILADAKEIANEWVTDMRLQHVLDKIPQPHEMSTIRTVIEAMIADVYREGKGEIIESSEVAKSIGGRAAFLYKGYLNGKIEKQ